MVTVQQETGRILSGSKKQALSPFLASKAAGLKLVFSIQINLKPVSCSAVTLGEWRHSMRLKDSISIKDRGGEFKLLAKIIKPDISGPRVVVPNGDDASVVWFGGRLLAVSTDCFVEERHFRFEFSTPVQVGKKVIHASASDIVAMGGHPSYMWLSLSAPAEMETRVVEELYEGVYAAGEELGVLLLGGDTVESSVLSVSVTVAGEIESETHLTCRGGAKRGDVLFVSGPLGAAAAGVLLLERGVEGFEATKNYHREPKCRLDVIDDVAPYATSLIDISDGLSGELHHIADQSGVGCVIQKEQIPLQSETREAAEVLEKDPHSFALHGGEDFEMLYTVDPSQREQVPGVEIGIVTENLGVYLATKNGLEKLPAQAWDHFQTDTPR